MLAVLMEGKVNMQKTALERNQEKIFEKKEELEEQKTKDALILVQREHKLIKCEGERGKSEDAAKVGVAKSSRSVV